MAFIDDELRLIHAIALNKRAIEYIKTNSPKSNKRDRRIKAHKILIKKYNLALKELSL
ncbi:hypothetical protein [Campylobacter lanienae]|uniref:hypothetical protein n=1 Tax=Campylobacter lanienae TaxID=75658 RepID=UPI0015D8F7A1|nr:hypothetical protein [Campylobacter lanienae]